MLHEIENLIEATPGTPEAERLDVLVTLVEAYEANHFPIHESDDPVAVLEYYMESRGLNRTDLIPFLGSKERVSEILNRKRGFSLEMIRRLHTGLGIPADLLVGVTPSTHNPRSASSAAINPGRRLSSGTNNY